MRGDVVPRREAAVWLGVVGAGALAAAVVPSGPPGIGILLVALAVAGVVVAARRVPRDLDAIGAGAAALLLAAMAVVRDAAWVVAVDVLAAAACAGVAVRGAATWRATFAAPFRVAAAAARVPVTLARVAPRPAATPAAGSIARAIGVSALLLAAFGGLFASADAAFARIAGDVLFPEVDAELLPARVAVAVLVAAGAGGLVLAGRETQPATETAGHLWGPERRPLTTIEWALPLALLDALFAAFVVVQVAVLFGGHRHVLTTQGLTYAQYARAGFFQLVVVAVLTLGVVALARKLARDDRPGLQKVLLGILCALTLVILASALRRMNLYEATYGLTRIRVAVYAVDLWLAGVFALVMVAGLLRAAPWLPRAVVAFSAAALLAFNTANPDAWIARSGVERWRATGDLDRHYLSTLGADAVGPLLALPPEQRACVLGPVEQRLRGPEPWTSFNLSRARARDLLAMEDAACTYP